MCIDHCDKHGYVVAAMVVGETADWEHVERLIASGLVEVIVVGKGSHLPPDRTPRIEVVDG